MVDVFLPLALAFIMFSLGLSLRSDDFLRVFKAPKLLVLGLFGQLVLVPVIAAVLIALFQPPLMIALGLMVLAACPGGASSGFLTHLARGNAALSLMLSAISSLLALLSFPVLLHWSSDWLAASDALAVTLPAQLPLGKLVASVLLVMTLPILAGMGLHHRYPAWAARWLPAVNRVASGLFLLIVFGTFFAHRDTITANLLAVGPLALLMNLLAMAVGYGLIRLARGDSRAALAVAMECGLQNAGLGIYVALGVLALPALAVPSVVYALMMNLGALGLVAWVRRRGAAAQAG
ncbi:MAG: bile acid:sodium symporter family protein [Azonexus sp.]|nr:bile acid:sodium symporter family protein [Azonexus sp.]